MLRIYALCDVHFMQVSRRGKKFNTCVVGLSMDGTKLRSEETTLHMYTALDIAAVHVERQLVDYIAKYHKQSVAARIRRHLRRDWL